MALVDQVDQNNDPLRYPLNLRRYIRLLGQVDQIDDPLNDPQPYNRKGLVLIRLADDRELTADGLPLGIGDQVEVNAGGDVGAGAVGAVPLGAAVRPCRQGLNPVTGEGEDLDGASRDQRVEGHVRAVSGPV